MDAATAYVAAQYGGAASSTMKRKLGHASALGDPPIKRARKTNKPTIKTEIPPYAAVIDLTTYAQYDAPVKAETKSKGKSPKKTKTDEEKRLSRWRKQPPQSFWSYHERAMTQRMFVLNRSRGPPPCCRHSHISCPSETISLAGTTGNVYSITIMHKPTCTCPDFQKGNPQCKHIVYVLAKVLKAPSPLNYQLAFLTSELEQIFANAGPLPEETVGEEDKDGRRHPLEGDCAICCDELSLDGEEVVWCRAACGNNLHKTCFEQWARTKNPVTCPYCRTPWMAAEGGLKDVTKGATMGAEGYVNVAQQLGLSGRRNYGTYHSYWVEREIRAGRVAEEEYYGDY